MNVTRPRGTLPAVDDELDRLLDETRADEAAAARARERWLRRQAEEDARLAGVLLDLAESGRVVAVTMAGGRVHHGILTLVGADCAVLHDQGGNPVHLALGAIASVVPEPGAPSGPATGERAPASAATLLDLLLEISALRPGVQVVTRGSPQGLVGQLVAVGTDVLTIRLDSEQGRTCYVAAQSVVSVSVFDSG